MPFPGVVPQLIQSGSMLCVETLDGNYRDITVLRIDPGVRRSVRKKKGNSNEVGAKRS
jgi:hypothetical protein